MKRKTRTSVTNPKQQYKLGMLYLERSRKSIKRNKGKSAEKLLDVFKNLDRLYIEGIGWLRKAAEQNYAPAQNKLGWEYEVGMINFISGKFDKSKLNTNIDTNKKEALKLYRAAAKQGYAPAQKSLGVMLLSGRTGKRNFREGLKWLQESVKQGHVDAMFFMGNAYSRWSKRKNYKKAAFWYKRAADKGHSYAQAALAWMYRNGKGIKKNDAAAFRLYKYAAAKGVPHAINNIAQIYELGQGVKQNIAQAIKWYRKMTIKGICGSEVEAILHLGQIYEEGLGVKQSYARAKKWYEKAIKRSEGIYAKVSIKAKEALERIQNKI